MDGPTGFLYFICFIGKMLNHTLNDLVGHNKDLKRANYRYIIGVSQIILVEKRSR